MSRGLGDVYKRQVLAHGKLLADGTPSEVFVQKEVLKKAALDMPHPLQLRKALEQI